MMRYAVPAGTAALVAAGVVHQWAGDGLMPTLAQLALPASMAVAYSSLGALVLAHRPGHRVGRLMALVGACATVAVLSLSWLNWPGAGWLSQWAWWPPVGLVPVVLLVFPDGRLPGPRWRPFAVGLTVAALVPAVALAAATAPGGRPLLAGTPATGASRILIQIGWLGIAATALGLLGVIAALVGRFRAANLPVRRQLLCAAGAGVTVLLGELLDTVGVPVAWVAEGVALPLALALAILRLGLYELDVYLNRAVVWLVMTVAVTATYVLVVGVVGGMVLDRGVGLAALALTALVATSFEPARRVLQRAVDRLLFGHRDDPYTVLARLGRHLEEVVAPTAVLPRLVATITDELQVPYAAVEITDGAGRTVAVTDHGRRVVEPYAFPLVTHRQPVGALLVSPRRAGDRFTRAERRLLRALARQAAVAVEAYRLTLDLQRSRERIVLAREEERRRLRTDLHDGLGPGLAGMAMQVRAARRHLDPDTRAAHLLDGLTRDLEACGREVRHLVDRLHPPALDHGLPAALRREAGRFATDTLTVDVDCPDDLGVLPAAVEVAALRIVAEALTNVGTHAAAATCRVVVRRGDTAVELTVTDDGRGLPAEPRAAGVGLGSMRERAEELTGTCTVDSVDPHGTRVAARLPLPEAPEIARMKGEPDVEDHLAGRGAVVERPLPARLP